MAPNDDGEDRKLAEDRQPRTVLCQRCSEEFDWEQDTCPECGWELKRPCNNCQRPLSLHWNICPYCETEQDATRQKER